MTHSGDLRRLFRTLALLAVFPLVILLVNLTVDPAHILTGRYAGAVADILLSGKNATNMDNLDDRDLLIQYFNRRQTPIQVLTLGSSRSMQITKELLGCEDCFCAGVTGADLRDSISVYEMAKQHGLQPKKVIFCAEYWFLSDGDLDPRANTGGYEDFCAQTGNTPLRSPSRAAIRSKELLSMSYFQSSLQYLCKTDRAKLTATDASDGVYATRRADGSYSYEESYRLRAQERIDRDAQDSCLRNSLQLGFNGVSDELLRQIGDFIAMMQQDGVEVVLQLAPYHPIYYSYMVGKEDYREILATEQIYRELADRYGIACFGGYDPAAFGMTNADFYDAQHPSAEGIYRYFGQMPPDD